MKSKIFFLLILLWSILFAQNKLTKFQPTLSHLLNPAQEFGFSKQTYSQPDTINLLAVMVDFAIDQDAATYGNGKFGSHYSKDYGKFIIDPLPHDKKYFESHLEFLKNYYLNVSDGRVIINYKVLDRVIHLPHVMSYYSPSPKSNDLSRLGLLFQEVWKQVDSVYKDQEFSEYDAFTIFHAGVGRDIIIPETFGLEKDIPSVYLSLKTLKNFLGEDFQGIQIGTPPKLVTNSMILPETESRELQTLTGSALLELSINGLLAASFGSYLGLPDLFDTKTGKSAIGRFGLMDGQAMFAYSGLFPPEPSAWEKIFLGWVEPVIIDKDTQNVEVLTRLFSTNNQKTVYKIPINSREYYLIENRQKDARKDGVKIKSQLGVNLLEYNFTSDYRRFSSFYVDTVDGVVIDVDEFDWATPGNGILIWHIDEKIIAENFESNSINAFKIKGVRLIEADGIEDVGKEFTTIFGDVIVGEGDSVDFWFAGNPSDFYRNEFSNTTRPRTLSNSGAHTYIRIFGFTSNDNLMKFNVAYGNDDFKILLNRKILNSAKVSFVHQSNANKNFIFFLDDSVFCKYNIEQNSLDVISNSVIGLPVFFKSATSSINKDYYAFLERNNLKVIEVDSSNVNYYSFAFSPDEATPTLIAYHLEIPPRTLNTILEFATRNGKIINFDLNSFQLFFTSKTLPEEPLASAFDGNNVVYLSNSKIYYQDGSVLHSVENPSGLVVLKEINILTPSSSLEKPLTNNSLMFVVFNMNGDIELLSEQKSVSRFRINSTQKIQNIVTADLNNNEDVNLIANTGDEIIAYNTIGVIEEGFPIKAPNGTKFTGGINLLNYNGDDLIDLMVLTEDGRLIIFDGKKKSVLTFNLLANYSIGYSTSYFGSLYNEDGQLKFIFVSDSGNIQTLKISNEEKLIFWTSKKGNLSGNSFVIINSGQRPVTEFLPKDKVYNWPNPVYGNQTNFRVYVSEDANVTIRIYDYSGSFVDEIKGTAIGGLENEFIWNVSKIESGIYLARVEVSSQNKTDFKIIKVAVVK